MENAVGVIGKQKERGFGSQVIEVYSDARPGAGRSAGFTLVVVV